MNLGTARSSVHSVRAMQIGWGVGAQQLNVVSAARMLGFGGKSNAERSKKQKATITSDKKKHIFIDVRGTHVSRTQRSCSRPKDSETAVSQANQVCSELCFSSSSWPYLMHLSSEYPDVGAVLALKTNEQVKISPELQ